MDLPSQFSTDIDFEFLQSVFDAIPEAVIIADTERNILSVNKSFAQIFGYAKDEVLGKQTSILYSSKADYEQVGEINFNPNSNVKSIIYEIEYQRRNGETFWGETVASVVEDKQESTIGYLGFIRDLSVEKNRQQELTFLTKHLQLLAKITTGNSQNPKNQIQQALELTTNMLGFEIGIVSSINGSTYTINYHYPDGIDLKQGMEFELADTYCSITVEADDVVAIDRMKDSPYKGHSCYKNFELESYIGIPLVVEGQTYGTVNFSSTQPKTPPFREVDKDMIRLLGQWIESVLERKQIQQQLFESSEKFRLISEKAADMVCLHDVDGTYEYISPSCRKYSGLHTARTGGG